MQKHKIAKGRSRDADFEAEPTIKRTIPCLKRLSARTSAEMERVASGDPVALRCWALRRTLRWLCAGFAL